MIIVGVWLGLGNQLFQYAYARNLKEQGYDVVLDTIHPFKDLYTEYKNNDKRECAIQNLCITIPMADERELKEFNYIRKSNIADKVKFEFARIGLSNHKFYDETAKHKKECLIKPYENSYIKGWFQDERYFINIKEILKNEFKPKYLREELAEKEKLLKNVDSVFVHVRRGDYVRIHHDLNMAYYRIAIKKMKEKKPNAVFCVFSDDILWVKNHLDVDAELIWMNEDRVLKDYEELYLMSKCKSGIISNSTFSWWSAWLMDSQEKTIIAPSKWLPGQENIIPVDWMVI